MHAHTLARLAHSSPAHSAWPLSPSPLSPGPSALAHSAECTHTCSRIRTKNRSGGRSRASLGCRAWVPAWSCGRTGYVIDSVTGGHDCESADY